MPSMNASKAWDSVKIFWAITIIIARMVPAWVQPEIYRRGPDEGIHRVCIREDIDEAMGKVGEHALQVEEAVKVHANKSEDDNEGKRKNCIDPPLGDLPLHLWSRVSVTSSISSERPSMSLSSRTGVGSWLSEARSAFSSGPKSR